MRRAIVMSLLSIMATLAVGKFAQYVSAPISNAAVLAVAALLIALFLTPAITGWASDISYRRWNQAGLALAVVYFCGALYAHHAALNRVRQFAQRENIHVDSIGALPFPPTLWHWDGLIRSPRGVYELRMDLSQSNPNAPIQDTYYPDAFSNSYIDSARRLPEVQTVLWFARFPVTRFHVENGTAVVEFLDLRFPQIRPDRPASFVYQVRYAKDGKLESQGWLGR